MMRQGTKTGYTTDDWVASATSNNNNPPDWSFSSTTGKTLPAIYEAWADLNLYYGSLNPTQESLSTDEFLASSFKVYPNPANNYITIESNNMEISGIVIYDILGKNVLVQKQLKNNSVNVSALNRGVYFIKISADNNSSTKKIILK